MDATLLATAYEESNGLKRVKMNISRWAREGEGEEIQERGMKPPKRESLEESGGGRAWDLSLLGEIRGETRVLLTRKLRSFGSPSKKGL